MKQYLRMSLYCLGLVVVICITAWIFSGCASDNFYAKQDTMDGLTKSWRGFEGFPNEDPALEKVVHIKDLEIVIVGQPIGSMEKMRAFGTAVSFGPYNRIVILGKTVDGRVVPFVAGLGYELLKILHKLDEGVVHPYALHPRSRITIKGETK